MGTVNLSPAPRPIVPPGSPAQPDASAPGHHCSSGARAGSSPSHRLPHPARLDPRMSHPVTGVRGSDSEDAVRKTREDSGRGGRWHSETVGCTAYDSQPVGTAALHGHRRARTVAAGPRGRPVRMHQDFSDREGAFPHPPLAVAIRELGRSLLTHPAARGRRLSTFLRALRWQVGSSGACGVRS
jgi:hypothetical protein